MILNGRRMVWSDDYMDWVPEPVRESEFGWKPLILWFVLMFALIVVALSIVVAVSL